ncbi:hypothetical protein B0H11DRAFT_340085 [Mycena galericulata]|nr:hypothetical protein B0H11DRAFT_340085 [Mycena galericulata]
MSTHEKGRSEEKEGGREGRREGRKGDAPSNEIKHRRPPRLAQHAARRQQLPIVLRHALVLVHLLAVFFPFFAREAAFFVRGGGGARGGERGVGGVALAVDELGRIRVLLSALAVRPVQVLDKRRGVVPRRRHRRGHRAQFSFGIARLEEVDAGSGGGHVRHRLARSSSRRWSEEGKEKRREEEATNHTRRVSPR